MHWDTARAEILVLNLVYNPGGAFLPGDQAGLEADYKRELKSALAWNLIIFYVSRTCRLADLEDR